MNKRHFIREGYAKNEDSFNNNNSRIFIRKSRRQRDLSFPDKVASMQKHKRILKDPFLSFDEKNHSIGVVSTDKNGSLSIRTPKIYDRRKSKSTNKDSIYKLITQNSNSISYRDRMQQYTELDTYAQELKEKDREIKILTRAVKEMKRKMGMALSAVDIKFNNLPATEREKFEKLLNENRLLREENYNLKMKNQYLSRRLDEQTKILKVGLDRQIINKRPKKEENPNSMINLVLKWYYKMSDQMEKIAVSSFKNMKNYDFIKCFNYLLRDFLYILPAERYMFNITIDEKMSDVIDKPTDVGANPSIEDFYPTKMPPEAIKKLRKIQKNSKELREIIVDGPYCFIPIRMILPQEVILRNIGVLVFEKKSREKDIANTQKMMIKILIYFIAFLIIIYKERKRYDIIRGMFKSFSLRICDFLETKELSKLLITLKLELSKIYEAEDVTILIYNKKDSLFYALNPSYALSDYRQINEIELNKFSTTIGITSNVLKNGHTYFTTNPRGDPTFTSQIDNLTPLFVLKNLTISRLETNSKKIIGIMQIINQNKKMSNSDYVDMVNSTSKILANVVEYCVRGFDNQMKMSKVLGGVDQMKKLISSTME